MEGRRRITLHDQMTAGDRSSRNSLACLLLNDVVSPNNQKSETETEAEAEAYVSHQLSRSRSRTLLDMIREDEPHTKDRDHKSWKKAIKDKLRLKLTNGSASTSTTHNNNNNDKILSRSLPRNSLSESTHPDSDELNHQPPQQHQNDVVEEDLEISHSINDRSSSRFEPPVDVSIAGGESSDEAATAGIVNVSLMDLLEEIEEDSNKTSDDDEHGIDEFHEENKDEEDEGEKQRVEEVTVVEYNCCVCMVRHKGAAFIPCGHTFCRMCSRELWVNRGNCPLCNNFILEILDIF